MESLLVTGPRGGRSINEAEWKEIKRQVLEASRNGEYRFSQSDSLEKNILTVYLANPHDLESPSFNVDINLATMKIVKIVMNPDGTNRELIGSEVTKLYHEVRRLAVPVEDVPRPVLRRW